MAALAAESWPERARLDQAEITTACMLRYVKMADPDLLPPGRFPTLDALSARCEALPAFQATWPAEYVLPKTREGAPLGVARCRRYARVPNAAVCPALPNARLGHRQRPGS